MSNPPRDMTGNTRVGQVLRGRYEISECIGEGPDVCVYRATDRRLARMVVLTLLRDERCADAALRRRFAQEASRAARLVHPHILTVHDVDEDGDLPFVVFECPPARTLASIMREEGRLPADRAGAIALDVLDALAYAHAHDMAHPDLEPWKVLITDRGEVKIIGFSTGETRADAARAPVPAMGDVEGDVSPEHLQGRWVGPQRDLYGVGALLYEMLSGRRPSDAPPSVAGDTLPARPSRADALAGLSPALESVVTTALHPSPEARFADAGAMRAALAESLRALAPGLSASTETHAPSAPSPDAGARAGTSKAPIPSYSLADSGEFQAMPAIPPPPPVEPAPSSARSVIVLLLTLVFLAGIVYAAYVWVKPPGEVDVPSIVGLEESQARAMVEKLNLRLTIREFVYSDDAPGLVKSQDPAPGTSMRRGNDVRVVVSKGRQSVQVPALTGLDREAARRALEERGLTVKWLEDYSDRAPLGRVALQEPPGGTPVELETQVAVTISKGLPQVVAPSMVGASEKSAAEKAEKVGLKVRVVTQKSSATMPAGLVLEQSPKAGMKAAKGSTVELIVSSGPESRGVPSLKGLSLADARRNAEQQGFRIVVEGGGGEPEARVTDQQPEGGATMPQGGVIRVTLDVPPPTPESSDEAVSVPGVRGMTLESARALLEERGLRVGNTELEESDAPAGTVVRQSPDEGATLRRGSAVDLVIAEKRTEPSNK